MRVVEGSYDGAKKAVSVFNPNANLYLKIP